MIHVRFQFESGAPGFEDITTENDYDDVRDNRRRIMFSLKISGEPSAHEQFC